MTTHWAFRDRRLVCDSGRQVLEAWAADRDGSAIHGHGFAMDVRIGLPCARDVS
jgi:hypothetical protein